MTKFILFAALFISLSTSAQQASDSAHYRVIRSRMGTAGVHLTTIGNVTMTTIGDSLHQGKILFVDVRAECIGKTLYGQTFLSQKEGDIWHQQSAHPWTPTGVFEGCGYTISAKDGRLLVTVIGATGQTINWTIVIKDK